MKYKKLSLALLASTLLGFGLSTSFAEPPPPPPQPHPQHPPHHHGGHSYNNTLVIVSKPAPKPTVSTTVVTTKTCKQEVVSTRYFYDEHGNKYKETGYKKVCS